MPGMSEASFLKCGALPHAEDLKEKKKFICCLYRLQFNENTNTHTRKYSLIKMFCRVREVHDGRAAFLE